MLTVGSLVLIVESRPRLAQAITKAVPLGIERHIAKGFYAALVALDERKRLEEIEKQRGVSAVFTLSSLRFDFVATNLYLPLFAENKTSQFPYGLEVALRSWKKQIPCVIYTRTETTKTLWIKDICSVFNLPFINVSPKDAEKWHKLFCSFRE